MAIKRMFKPLGYIELNGDGKKGVKKSCFKSNAEIIKAKNT